MDKPIFKMCKIHNKDLVRFCPFNGKTITNHSRTITKTRCLCVCVTRNRFVCVVFNIQLVGFMALGFPTLSDQLTSEFKNDFRENEAQLWVSSVRAPTHGNDPFLPAEDPQE